MDEVDRMHAEEVRRTNLRSAVTARIAEIEAELPSLIEEVSRLQKHEREWLGSGLVSPDWSEIRDKSRLRDALVAEHAVLEGLLDRYATRLRANVALAVAVGSIVLAVINFIRQL